MFRVCMPRCLGFAYHPRLHGLHASMFRACMPRRLVIAYLSRLWDSHPAMFRVCMPRGVVWPERLPREVSFVKRQARVASGEAQSRKLRSGCDSSKGVFPEGVTRPVVCEYYERSASWVRGMGRAAQGGRVGPTKHKFGFGLRAVARYMIQFAMSRFLGASLEGQGGLKVS